MKIVVTGGLGFIGSTVTDVLALDHDVWVVDDCSSNVVESCDSPASLILGRIDGVIRSLPMDVDVVVHCASPVGAAGILPKAGRIASAIVSDTQIIVDYCRATRARLVNVSTSEVYGFSGVYHESDDARVPADPSARIEYAVGKLAAEATVRLTPGLQSVTLRPFNVAGARQSRAGGFVLPTFAEQAVRGEALTVYESGTQERCLTAVDDVAEFIARLEPHHFDGRVVNVGNPANRTSILGLALHVAALAGADVSNVAYTTGRAVHGAGYAEAEGEIKVPDVSTAERIGWQPRVGLDELIHQAVDHARAQARLPAAGSVLVMSNGDVVIGAPTAIAFATPPDPEEEE